MLVYFYIKQISTQHFPTYFLGIINMFFSILSMGLFWGVLLLAYKLGLLWGLCVWLLTESHQSCFIFLAHLPQTTYISSLVSIPHVKLVFHAWFLFIFALCMNIHLMLEVCDQSTMNIVSDFIIVSITFLLCGNAVQTFQSSFRFELLVLYFLEFMYNSYRHTWIVQ